MATKRRSPHISGKNTAARLILGEGIKGEFEAWRKLAAKTAPSLSEWIRRAAREKAEREK